MQADLDSSFSKHLLSTCYWLGPLLRRRGDAMMNTRGGPCTQGPPIPGNHTVKVQSPTAISTVKENP